MILPATRKMKPEVKKKWVEALRSGQYVQGHKALRIQQRDGSYTFCCLGVLCDIHAKETGKEWDDGNLYMDHEASLPRTVRDWAGLDATNSAGVSFYNDTGDGFSTIANRIEGQL